MFDNWMSSFCYFGVPSIIKKILIEGSMARCFLISIFLFISKTKYGFYSFPKQKYGSPSKGQFHIVFVCLFYLLY